MCQKQYINPPYTWVFYCLKIDAHPSGVALHNLVIINRPFGHLTNLQQQLEHIMSIEEMIELIKKATPPIQAGVK
jgi:hypothetical protein